MEKKQLIYFTAFLPGYYTAVQRFITGLLDTREIRGIKKGIYYSSQS